MQSFRSTSSALLRGTCRTAPSRLSTTSSPLAFSAHRSLSHTSRTKRSPTTATVRTGKHAGSPISNSSVQASSLQVRHGSSAASSESLAKTPLYDLHLAHGGKMVPFGGFQMPVQYSGLSVSQSHHFTREHSSIFDVSHMVQRMFTGPGAAQFLQRVTPSDIEGLGEHRSTLSTLMTTDGTGGISDDTIITRLPEQRFYVVTNAGCRNKDNAYFEAEMAKWNAEPEHQTLQVEQSQLDGWGLVALQGPEAEAVLAETLANPEELDLKKLLFGQSAYAKLKLAGTEISSPLLISRGGYTGEDGFEISIPVDESVGVTEAILATGGPERVQFAGLGARDSLRLEAGMCLYGHDLNDTITPVEAALSWIIPKERRKADAGFYGAEVIAKQLVPKSKGGFGVQRRRVGLLVEGAPAREGAEIVTRATEGAESRKIGVVTSGCPSPTLGKNIAMGYVEDGLHKSGTEVDVLVRGRPRKAVITKMPFVPTKYWKGVAPA